MVAKLRVGLLYGGRSVEHEVSIQSAASILRNLDPSRYEVWPLAIAHDGSWRLGAPGTSLENAMERGAPVLLPASPHANALLRLGPDRGAPVALDVVFSIIHGHGGEDGTLQGLLELAGLPYVGSGVLGSSLQMDKEVSKRLLEQAGLPVGPWRAVHEAELARDARAVALRLVDELGLPVFVKPANSGSSVGIEKIRDVKALPRALAKATRYDTKLVVEAGLDAREIEVAVLGNEAPEASVPGEICPRRDWYDYEAKYVDESTELLVPAPLSDDESEHVRDLAVRAFHALEGAGAARADFLLERRTGEFFVNELNSLPGFTEVSMYPRLWEASGLPYPQLLDRLIELALARHRRRARLETLFRPG
ncbi:D-alanine--D-alanine ligase [Myxococcota bacterium]|nr:D-alanine--D-alanine ligase [Myxococcota bacterium]MCZ7617935.1 D-alanine--D-alanine ligase [Myxococcota bacterium]